MSSSYEPTVRRTVNARRPATAPPRVQASAFTSVVEPPTLPCVHEEVQAPVLSDAERLATVQLHHRRALDELMQRVASDRKPCSLRPRIRIWEQELAAVSIRLGRAKTPAKRLAAWQAVAQRFACCTKDRQPVAHAPEPVVAVDRPSQARHRLPPGVLNAQPASDASTHRQPPTASCIQAPNSLYSYGPCERSDNSSRPTRANNPSSLDELPKMVPTRAPRRGMRATIRGGFNSARVAPCLVSSTGTMGQHPLSASVALAKARANSYARVRQRASERALEAARKDVSATLEHVKKEQARWDHVVAEIRAAPRTAGVLSTGDEDTLVWRAFGIVSSRLNAHSRTVIYPFSQDEYFCKRDPRKHTQTPF